MVYVSSQDEYFGEFEVRSSGLKSRSRGSHDSAL
jgi:hypothetical protein